jgi:hypothetical protein
VHFADFSLDNVFSVVKQRKRVDGNATSRLNNQAVLTMTGMLQMIFAPRMGII